MGGCTRRTGRAATRWSAATNSLAEFDGGSVELTGLEFQQPFLARHSPAVTADPAVSIDHPVAGDGDRQLVGTVRLSRRPERGRPAHPASQLHGRDGIAVRYAPQSLPNLVLEGRAHQADVGLETGTLSREVLAELPFDGLQRRRRAGKYRVAAPQPLHFGFQAPPLHELEQHQLLLVRDRQHRAKWRVDPAGVQHLLVGPTGWRADDPVEGFAEAAA